MVFSSKVFFIRTAVRKDALLWQAVHSCAQMQILRCKMLVGKSQTLFDLHRSGAGCAFFPNAIECVNAHSLRKSGALFGASVNGIIPKFMIE